MSEPSVANKTLLIIDDDQSVIDLVSMILSHYAAQLWTSTNPLEGIQLAKQHQPNLILLDNNMPEMLGTEVLQQLRQKPSTAAIPVIMMTADNSLETLQTVVKENVNGYLLKPCDPDTLVETVAPWLGIKLAPKPRELTSRLGLLPEQLHQLELRSVLGAVDLLNQELQKLITATGEAQLLSPCLAGLADFREALSRQGQRFEILGDLETFESLLFQQVELVFQAHSELSASLPLESRRSRLQTLFRAFRQRAHELIERIENPLLWKKLPASRLRQHLYGTLEAFAAFPESETLLFKPEQALMGYHVEVDILGPELLLIPSVLQDVMRDLVTNAYQQTPRGGWISSRLSLENSKLSLRVGDGGQGLNSHDLERLAREIPRGSGGLTRAYAVTKFLGGRFWLTSAPGAGLLVSLEIPLPAEAGQA